MTRLLVAGYKNSDLGIFKDKDKRLDIIRFAIRRDLQTYLDNQLDWLIFTGSLGFEYWVLEECLALRDSYDFQMACIFPFATQGQNWNEANQEKLARFKQLDFVTAAYPAYENPGQFHAYHQFLLENTDEAYLFYDREQPTNLKFLYEKIQQPDYSLKTLTFDDLNDIAENFSNFDR